MSNRADFFELIARVNAVEDRHHDVLPDINAQLLLMRVALAHHAGTSLNVTQAMNLAHIGSPAMLHRKINDLLNQGLIELTFEGNNRRTKFLVPTAQAYAIIDELADAAASVYDTVK
jgi:hypothetical protein